MTDDSNNFCKYIHQAMNDLKENNFVKAEKDIKQAMFLNPHSPVVHNLYGILEELLMKDNLARNHYRAACALDPTYKPAIHNLDRISTFDNSYNRIDFGDQPENEV